MNHSAPKYLFIEACNYVDAPVGGQLSFARQMLACWGTEIAYAGWTNDSKDPIGKWFKKRFGSLEVDYFAFHRQQNWRVASRFVPARMITAFEILRRQRRMLDGRGTEWVFTSEPSVLVPLRLSASQRLAYYFPGVGSPLSVSRFPVLRPLADLFEKLIFRSLCKADLLLAAADSEAVAKLKQRAAGLLARRDVHFFPSRVDTSCFKPTADRTSIRACLQVPADAPLLVTTGRIHMAKGFDLLLQALVRFRNDNPKTRLVFVGDGPQRRELLALAADLGLTAAVSVTGFVKQPEVVAWLQAADLFIMGSVAEGWSTSLVEALSCGLPIVTTRFSSADTLVNDGVNGYVVSRDPAEFSEAMKKALRLPHVREHSRLEAQKYSLSNLAPELEALLARS